jgi:hypothetical protein
LTDFKTELYVSGSGSLPTMRLLTAAKILHADKLENLSREFWTRIFRTVRSFILLRAALIIY